jgi:selenide,water dikinase
MSPAELDKALAQVVPYLDPNLLVGYDHSDDAAVYKISDDLAVVHTLDFFTPIVDDPYIFGRIAAANSLSDIYAMGARPLVALNIVSFPSKLPAEVLGDILRGGMDTVRQAGIPIGGGHTLDGPEPAYGLSIAGTVHPDRILTNGGALPGDALILTKPIGSGVITTALRAGLFNTSQAEEMIQVMMELNKVPAEVMANFDIHSCTDITGYGLLGHATEVAIASGYGWEIHANDVPIVEPALEAIEAEAVPGGSQVNLVHFSQDMDISHDIPENLMRLMFDAQTSGGLLVAVDSKDAERLLGALQNANVTRAAIIGTMTFDDRRVLIP